MTTENSILEKQLLIKGINSSYITKEVIAKNVSGLFDDEINKQFGYILVKYYMVSSEIISRDTFLAKIEEYVNRENKHRERTGDPLITNEESATMFSYAKELVEAEEDDNSQLQDELNSYIKDRLITLAIIEEVAKKTPNLSGRVSKRTQEIEDLDITSKNGNVINIFRDLDKKQELYKKGFSEENRIKFGIEPLDAVTGGGLLKGQIGLIAGLSGFGKTAILSNLSYYYVKSGYNVLHISLEELESDMVLRLDRILTGAGVKDVFDFNGKIKESYLNTIDSYYDKLNKGNHKELLFYKSNPQTETVDSISHLIRRFERESNIKLDVVVLDYADLLKGAIGGDNEAQNGELLFQKLSKMANERDVLLITGTQLNRQAKFADVKTLAYIEGSKRKENTIAFGVTLNASPEEKKEGFLRIYLDKVRNSYGYPDDFIYLKYNLKNMKLNPENDVEKAQHLSLIDSSGSQQSMSLRDKVKKDNPQQSMIDAINKSIVVE